MSDDWKTHPWLHSLGDYRKRPLSGFWDESEPDQLKKAWDLLLEHLDPHQIEDLLNLGWFEVISSVGQRIRISANWDHTNVTGPPISPGYQDIHYCTAPAARVPLWDYLLSQLLAIKYDWEYFSEKAIRM